MNVIQTVNQKQEGDHAYACIFMGKTVGIYAQSLYEAKLKAIDYFKPSKKLHHMISVLLIEKDGGTYEQPTDF